VDKQIYALEVEPNEDVTALVMVTLAVVWLKGQLKVFEVHCSECHALVHAGNRLGDAITELDEHSWRHCLMGSGGTVEPPAEQ
jgi:mono/diheme cytochrome c family protein